MAHWRAREDELLVSFLHKDQGGGSNVKHTWSQIAQLMTEHAPLHNIDVRDYTEFAVRGRCVNHLLPRLRQERDQAAAKAERVANTLPPLQEGWEIQRPAVSFVPTFQPKQQGPPGSFREYKDRKNKQ